MVGFLEDFGDIIRATARSHNPFSHKVAMHYLIERNRTPLFGSPKRAEAIVSWSERHPDGSRFSQSYPTGISLELVAHGPTPRVFLYFKPSELGKRLKELGKPEVLHLAHTGFSVQVKDGGVKVALLAHLPNQANVLWRGRSPLESNFPELLGNVELAEDGIRFYPKDECPATTTTVVKPLAVIGGAPPKPLSTQARRWLVRDVIANALLTPAR